jgi:glutathionylspermidine synthase
MPFDKKDALIGFVIGVLSSITAVILWDFYKKKRELLEYSEKKLIEEIHLNTENLKKHITETNGKNI